MNMKKNKPIRFSLVFQFFLVTFLGLSPLGKPVAFAANTTMGVTPLSGTYEVGNPVHIDLAIDGHGDTFNAAQATVTLSQNLSLTDLTLGDCNFSFVATPTTANPSFAGVILGGSSQKCTVYTLTLLPLSTGTGIIAFSNTSVKGYPNAQETLVSTQNGTYTLTASATGGTAITPPPDTPAQQSLSANGTYAITVQALNSDSTPISGAQVVLDPPEQTLTSPPAQKQSTSAVSFSHQTAMTDSHGNATFTNVLQGVHQAVVQADGKKLASNIFNATGTNHAIVLGLKEQKQANIPLIMLFAISSIALIVLLFILVLRDN